MERTQMRAQTRFYSAKAPWQRSGAAYTALARVFELAFPDNAFERFLRVLDPILVIGPVGGKQLHHLISAVGDHVTDGPGGEIDGLTNTKLMLFQRGSPGHQRRGLRHGFAPIRATPLPIGVNIAQKSLLPQKILFLHGKPLFPGSQIYSSMFSVSYEDALE
jgi:hypothetical protein